METAEAFANYLKEMQSYDLISMVSLVGGDRMLLGKGEVSLPGGSFVRLDHNGTPPIMINMQNVTVVQSSTATDVDRVVYKEGSL